MDESLGEKIAVSIGFVACIVLIVALGAFL